MAAPAAAGWTRPVQIATTNSIEVLGPQVASSASGTAAVSFNEVDLDAQATASAFLALAAPHGPFSTAQIVPRVQEILALAYSGSTLELLTASGPSGQPCCSIAQVLRLRPGSGFGRPQTIATGLGGGTTGRLVALADGRMLAVVGGPQRLWATEARGSGSFAPARGLTRSGSGPAALAVTGTPEGGSAVVWTQGSGGQVFGAAATAGATPSRRHILLTVGAGHAVNGLQLVPGPDGLTMGWTESFSDSTGAYHSQAMAADLTGFARPVRARGLSAPADVASSLALASDGKGGEVATWEVCSPTSLACALDATSRPDAPPVRKVKKGKKAKPVRVRWFGAPSRLGSIDAGESPDLTMAANREALEGWITGGRVVLAELLPDATRFGAARHTLSGTLADNLALGFGPTGEAVASWTQGTYSPNVFASRSGPPPAATR